MKMPNDKVKHILVCAIVSALVCILTGYVLMWSDPTMRGFDVRTVSAMFGVLASSLLGVGKEYGDHCAEENHWCLWDILADIIGATIGCGIGIIILML